MTKRFITDEELAIAAAMVSEAMLRALPEPEECIGQFTAQFEEKIEKLKKTAVRKANWRKFARSAVAAVLVVLIGFSMLCVFNTEVRATFIGWFKKTFDNYTTYWFSDNNDEDIIPEYEINWIPEGYELIFDEVLPDSIIKLYQNPENELDGFTFNCYKPQADSPVKVEMLGSQHIVEQVNVNEFYGDLYLSLDPNESHCLIWSDDNNQVTFAITSFLPPDDIMHIAESVKLVNSTK